ncbi:MAG: 4-hydroxy-3-methylbut-2-enyl diphosphate reductase, partial [Plesiomonas sp.]
GSKNSSHSTRLAELANRSGKAAYLIDGAEDINEQWLQGVNTVGLTAGASAPEVLVKAVIDRLQQLGGLAVIESPGREENIIFEVPKELRVQQID